MTTAAARDRFSRIVQPSLDEAVRLARWLTGSAADAEDVVQEASLRAFKAIEGYVEGNARAWFLTIVRNTCYSWLLRRQSWSEVHSEELSIEELAVYEPGGTAGLPPSTPESELIRKDDADQLSRAIGALPLPLRECLILREYHDLSYREIAAVSGVPIGTVMSRLARARQHLIARLSSHVP